MTYDSSADGDSSPQREMEGASSPLSVTIGAELYHSEVNPSNATVVTAISGDVEEPTAATV